MFTITSSRLKKAILHPQEALKYIINYFKGQWLRLELENRVLRSIFRGYKTPRHFQEIKSGIFFTENKKFLEEIAHQDFIIEAANRILNNEFGSLGIPPKILKNIDWYEDIKSGHTWPNDFYLDLREKLAKDYNKGWDIKNVWELSRFHYLIPLALAFYQTGEEKYLIKWQELIEDWIKNNPVYYGPNWINAMEVAIRACNWILSFEIINSKLVICNSKLKQEFLEKFLSSLFEHGRFIFNNLEYAPIRSNHYVTDVIGLIYLGVFFKNFKEGQKWLKFGSQAIEKEMAYQILNDGVDYELSISYHRYKTELFLWGAWLLKLNNIKLPSKFEGKLEKMVNFINVYTKPNSLSPQIGDSDDSRLHLIWEDLYPWEKRNHLAVNKLYQFASSSIVRINNGNMSYFFPEAGIFIMKDKNFYLITGRHQACFGKGGSHIHNDSLSFELNLNGEDIIIDPGTYVYTPDLIQRNEFRSTRKHNVLIIDNQEQASLSLDPFYIKQQHDICIINHSDNEDRIIFQAQLNNWTRQFVWQKQNKSFIITDKIIDKIKHTVEWNFHLSPQIKTWVKENQGNKREVILVGQNIFLFTAPKNLNCAIIEDEVSPSYGVKVPAKTIHLSGFVDKNSGSEFEFKIEPVK